MSKETQRLPEGYTSGEYAVGTVCFTVVGTNRKNVLDNGTGDRKIAVRMYYPADKKDAAGRDRAKVFSDEKKAALIKAYHIRKVDDSQNQAEYYEGLPIARDKKFPLIMFSAGYNSYVESNTYLLCALASHGYIIASVGHEYEALENDYEDGSTDLLDKRISKAMYTSLIGCLFAQGKLLKKQMGHEEALAAFDVFQRKYSPFLIGRVSEWRKDIEKALESVKERYRENIDLSRGIGVSGHSLGGCLAYYLCRYNDEFSCGINIDGALFGEYPESTMTRPFCQLCCRENLNCETRPFLNTEADTYQVVFDDMKHLGFTDAKFYIPVKFIVGKLAPDELFRHLVYCHIEFFGRYLQGADTSFDGLPSDKVTYTRIK